MYVSSVEGVDFRIFLDVQCLTTRNSKIKEFLEPKEVKKSLNGVSFPLNGDFF
jgi:hypothetical protein